MVSNAALSSGYKYKVEYLKVLGIGFFLAFYFFNSKGAQIQVKKFSLNPDHEVAIKMWNFLDTKLIKNIYTTSLPRVSFRKNLYLLKTEKQINKEFLSILINRVKNNKIDNFHDKMSEFNSQSERNLLTEIIPSKESYKTNINKNEFDGTLILIKFL